MKQVLIILAFGFLSTTVNGQSIPDDWKLTSKQASKMMQYFADCEGDCFTSTATPDAAKESQIREAYPNAKSVTWVNARYRAEDVARYSSRNTKAAKNGGNNVAGYTTKILKLVDEEEQVHYFDIASICPPPTMCD